MPTSRPRHFVTETDELCAALDAAARRWPGLRRSQLVVRLALEGHAAAAAESERRSARRAALETVGGALTGTYGRAYLQDLRGDWSP